MHSVIEGVYTTKAALQLADRYQVEMPITKQLSLVLFEGLDPRKAVPELMMRDPQHHAVFLLRCGRRAAEADQRVDQPAVAILEDQLGRLIARGLHLGGKLTIQLEHRLGLLAEHFE